MSAKALASTGPELLLVPLPPDTTCRTWINTMYFDRADAEKPGGAVSLTINDVSIKGQLPEPSNLVPLVGYQHTYIYIASDRADLPGQLLDQSVALGATLYKSGEWTLMGSFGVGYAGTNPYADGEGAYAKSDLILNYQMSAKDSLQFMINYNGNRTFLPDVPLPGVAWTHIESRDLRYTLGVPLSTLYWRPMDKLSIELGYLIPYNGYLTAKYEATEQLTFFVDIANRYQGFWIDGNTDRRIFFKQRTAEVGATFTLNKNADFTLAGGIAFDQEFERGFDSRSATEITEIASEPYVRAALTLRY